jgi:hypothetical protein
MSPDEAEAMQASKTVQESKESGTTHVAVPADPATFGKQAPAGSVYVEFDVPSAAVKQTSTGVGKIIGPRTLEGRAAERAGKPVPQMPPATNINIVKSK